MAPPHATKRQGQSRDKMESGQEWNPGVIARSTGVRLQPWVVSRVRWSGSGSDASITAADMTSFSFRLNVFIVSSVAFA